MSNSSIPPVSPAPQSASTEKGDIRATILNVTGSLQSLPRTVRVEGTIAQVNHDGSVTINTSHGDVTAILRTNQPPSQGQSVEVDIAGGQPPRQAVVRVTNDAVAQPPSESNASSQGGSPPVSGNPSPANIASASGGAPAPTEPDQGAVPVATGTAPASTPPPNSTSLAASTPLLTQEAVETLSPSLASANEIPVQTYVLLPGQPVRLLPLPGGTDILPQQPFEPGAVSASTLSKIAVFTDTANAGLPPSQSGKGTAPPLSASGRLDSDTPLTSPNTPGPGKPTLLNLLQALLRPSSLLRGATDRPGSSLANAGPEEPSDASTGKTPLNPFSSPAGRPLRFDVQVQAIRTPAETTEDFHVTALPETLAPEESVQTGTVTGFTRQGLPVITLPVAGAPYGEDFVMQFPASNLTPGTALDLVPQPSPDGLSTLFGLPGQPLSADPFGTDWPALRDLSSALNAAGPEALQALAQTIASPAQPAQMPAAALVYIAALQSGDLDLWLGTKTVNALRESGKDDLLARLSGDLDTAAKTNAQPLTQDWKALQLPLYYDGELQKAMLWHRHDGGGKDQEGQLRPRVTRFVFDFQLNRMGAVQLDGLAKPERIDLVVRTLKPVGVAMRQAMREKYEIVLKNAGFTGELAFQDRADQFLKIDTRGAAKAFQS